MGSSKILPGTEISAISSRALHTDVAVPSSHKASNAAKKEAADFLHLHKAMKVKPKFPHVLGGFKLY